MATRESSGHCLCGAVRFTGLGAIGPAEVCHCGACRRHGAGPLMSVYFSEGVRLDASDALKWYASSKLAERGFCGACGSVLFWRMHGAEKPSVSAHAVDVRIESIAEHVFVDEKPEWYDFADSAPRITSATMRERLEAYLEKKRAEEEG